jgi:hypothetical protein
MSNSPASTPGTLTDAYITMGQKAFAAGESATITVLKNNATILTTNVVLNSATPVASIVDFFSDLTTTAVAIGDEFTASANYPQTSPENNPNFSITLVWG